MRTRLSVFLITLSGLVLEVGLTRIYSASVWYHFAFVAISVALLGWGPGRLYRPPVEAKDAAVDEFGSAGRGALCRLDPSLFVAAGSLFV